MTKPGQENKRESVDFLAGIFNSTSSPYVERKALKMSDKTEMKIAVFIAFLLFVVGVVSYAAFPPNRPERPVRLMLEVHGQKNVLFDHQGHVDNFGLECNACHHAIAEKKGRSEQACGTCHKAGAAFKPALGKKGMFDHAMHSEDLGLSCKDCHHMYDEQSGGAPQACSACHMQTGDQDMPSIEDACHKQCISCHQDMGSGPVTNDCSACHKPRGRKDAFHNQCAGCHEDMGAGPVMSDCKKCHGY